MNSKNVKVSLSDLSKADLQVLNRAHAVREKELKREKLKLRKVTMQCASKYALFFAIGAKTDINKNAVATAVYRSLEPLCSKEAWFVEDVQNLVAGAIGQARLKIWNKTRDTILTNDDEDVTKYVVLNN